jgi:hypothetical protein
LIRNLNKGVIINRPGGPDVYNGTLKDYTLYDVTPDNFLKVLQGIPTNSGSKKVLKRFELIEIIDCIFSQ